MVCTPLKSYHTAVFMVWESIEMPVFIGGGVNENGQTSQFAFLSFENWLQILLFNFHFAIQFAHWIFRVSDETLTKRMVKQYFWFPVCVVILQLRMCAFIRITLLEQLDSLNRNFFILT